MAICTVLRDTLREINGPHELLDLVECSKAISTARRTYHELVTGKAPRGSRALMCAEDSAPWPSDQDDPPAGYSLFATGLDGADPLSNAIAQFCRKYAAHAIARRFHVSPPPLVLLKPSNGTKKNRLCMLMCVTAHLPLPPLPLVTR